MKDDEMNNDPMLDSEGVGDAVSQYFSEHPELLEGVEPSHDLWAGIESRIQARVVPLAAHSARSVAPSRMQYSVRKHRGWMTIAAAAAVLVVTTASVTYVLTTRGAGPFAGAVTPANPASVAANSSASPLATQTVATNPATINTPANTLGDSTAASRTSSSTASATSLASAGQQKSATGEDDDGSNGVGKHTGTRDVAQLASRPRLNGHDEVRSTYDEEIITLRAALDSRRGQLDPATVSTIEQNLQIIDHAIQQAKAALTKDPRSRFLNDQLDHSLAKKTDLLRAAALLPSA